MYIYTHVFRLKVTNYKSILINFKSSLKKAFIDKAETNENKNL